MAKIAGTGTYVAADDSAGNWKDISNDISSVSINLPTNMLEVTGLDKSAPERIGGLQDGSIGLEGYFNAATDKSHDVFKTRTTARTVTIAIGGNTSTNPKMAGEYIIENYDISLGDDRSLTWSVTLQLADGTVPTWTTVA